MSHEEEEEKPDEDVGPLICFYVFSIVAILNEWGADLTLRGNLGEKHLEEGDELILNGEKLILKRETNWSSRSWWIDGRWCWLIEKGKLDCLGFSRREIWERGLSLRFFCLMDFLREGPLVSMKLNFKD